MPRLLLAGVAMLFLGLLGLAGASVAAVAGVYYYFAKDLPPAEELERRTSEAFQTSLIYDRTGQTVLFELIDPQGGARTNVPLADIPTWVRYGTIAMEDKDFYRNPGVSLEGIVRAFVSNLQGNEIQGASTLTQQLVKLVLLSDEQYDITYTRKIKEAILSLELSRRYPGMEGKDKILEWYLNTVHYGRLAYGIQAAAEQYFGKDAKDLTLAESAMLVAVPQYPLLNPADDFEAAKRRQELVLDQLYLQGYITAEEAYAAKQEEIKVVSKPFDITAPHFVMYVRQLLEERYGLDAVYKKGLRVYTTLDLDLQNQVQQIARDQVTANSEKYNMHNAAVVAIDPHTGEILSMLGSLDYFDAEIDGQVNVATALPGRQPGSSFKPFTYVTAFSQGYTPATRVMDIRTSFDDSPNPPYAPEDYDRLEHGPVSLRRALGCSMNIPAVAVLSWVGVNNVLDTAHRMGINTLTRDYYGLSLTLGGGEVTLLDMTYAYSVFANQGVMAGEPVADNKNRAGFRELDPVAILRVEDSQGNVLYNYEQPHTKQIISPQLAYLITNVLSDNAARAPEFGWDNWLVLSRPAAAKTGTTENYRDLWTLGYTPDITVGVWVGNNDNQPMERIPSVRAAGPIWNKVMEYTFTKMPEADFLEPPGMVHVVVDEASGLLPTQYSGALKDEVFIEGTAPTTYDDLHRPFRVCVTSGKLATVYCPPNEVQEQVFEVFPPGAADWVRAQRIPQPPTEYCPIHGPGVTVADVAISSPRVYSSVRGIVPVVGNAKPGDFSYWRLQFGQGMNPSAWTPMTGERYDRMDNGVLAYWDASQLDGLYTLQLTVIGGSGNVQESAVQVTVDNISPTIQMLNPWPDKAYELETDEWVNIQVDAQDNVSMSRVEFFVDDKNVGFSTVAPFGLKWTMSMSDTLPAISPDVAPVPVEGSEWGKPTFEVTNPDGTVIRYTEDRSVFIATLPNGRGGMRINGVYTETHTIHAVAYDDAGNMMQSEKVRILIAHKRKEKEAEKPVAWALPSDDYVWKHEEEFRLPIVF